MSKDISYWRILRQPAAACRRKLQTGKGTVMLGWAVLAGCLVTLLWADAWNLGRRYDTGQILSVTLMAGPILGVLFFAIQTLIVRKLANTLSRRTVPASRIFSWNGEILKIWLPAAIWYAIPMFTLGKPVFAADSQLLLLWWIPLLPCIGIFVYHSLIPLRVAWGLEWLWSVAILAVSWSISATLLAFLLSFLAGISLF